MADDCDVEDMLEDDELVVTLIEAGAFDVCEAESAGAPSRRVRKPNKARDFDEAYQRFQRLYFSDYCVYDKHDFERRFRMPRALFERICTAIIGKGIFTHRVDATNKKGMHPMIRVIAALRVLAYGMSYDQVDELCAMSESSVKLTFEAFLTAICELFESTYLRRPNEDDLRRILAINASRGFPGCLGSWDCQHWHWKNCPVAWAGQFTGKEKDPTVVLEAIADGELWIWGCYFGSPGSMNDINVLDTSPLVVDILHGRLLPSFEYALQGKKRKMCYYLVDGIYPKWAIFVSTIAHAVSKKDKHFCAAQEGMRKDVERAFGVLVSRWHILAKPCNLWDLDIMNKTVKCAIILHNMIVEWRRDGYHSELWRDALDAIGKGMFIDENGQEKKFEWAANTVGENSQITPAWAAMLGQRENSIMDEVGHYVLKQDLVEHVWSEWGVAE